jgi:V/A-type H+-transporting ATPase subunit I
MTFTSIICVRKDVESVLEALSSFGEFHVEEAVEDNVSLREYSPSIQKAEDSLSNVNDLTKQLCQEKTGFLDVFRITQITKMQVTTENWQDLLETTSQQILTLKKEVDELNTSLSILQEKTAQLNHLKDMLTTIENMGGDLAAMEELKLIRITIAAVPHKNLDGLKTALANFPIILHRCYLAKNVNFVCLAMPSKYRYEIERILKIHHAGIFEIPQNLPHNATEALSEVNNQIKGSIQKENTVTDTLNKLGKKNNSKLASWHEITENILTSLQTKRKILESGRLATVKGFVPTKKFHTLTKKIRGMLGEKVLVLKNEVEPEDPPTKVSHSRFVSPFEELTKLYGVPHYDEVDPTPIMAITFPLIFGLMFGDIGHGLILLVGGLTLGKLIKKNQAIKNICWILAACGIGAMVAGALYGEFFGIELFHPLWFSPFSPLTNVFLFLIFSLFVGIVQIMSGLALEMVNFLFRRNYADAVLTSLPKMAFYAGAVILVAIYQLNFVAWFSGPILLVIVPFGVLVFAKPTFGALQSFSLRAVEAQNKKTSFGQRLFESGDLVTRLLSNTISYSRILALLMAHWALILVTYTVAGLIGTGSLLGLVISGIIIVGGNMFVLALEGLIVFIHTLRLHFYEWFSKFYQGNGTEFKAFKRNFVYTEVVLQKKQV